MSIAGAKLSHIVIRSLYNVLHWYHSKKSVPSSQKIINLFNLWKDLHAISINISEKGWESLRSLANSLSISLRNRDEEWLFLFSVETYLSLAIRLIALSKIGSAPQDINSYIRNIESNRNIFSYTAFEWVHEAVNDQLLDPELSKDLRDSLNTMIKVIYNLNLLQVSFDIFRGVYQRVFSRELRRSLGEFYTNEKLVNEVLDAVGLDCKRINDAYREWRNGDKKILFLDPACGSGTFLVEIIKRIFSCFNKPPPDIQDFVLETIVGIDINPFAVEMTKLNIIATLATELVKRGGVLNIGSRELKIYWADSLAKTKTVGKLQYRALNISIPALVNYAQTSNIEIPTLPHLPPTPQIIDIVYEYATSPNGLTSLTNWLSNQLANKYPKEVLNMIISDFTKLYNIMTAIHKSGNSRVIELIKSTLIVQDLIGRCRFVIGNPPWVRIHEQAPHVRNYLRQNFDWLSQGSSYDPGFSKTKVPFREQFDYSVAFLERGLEFLVDGGVLGYVITSKILKTSYAGKLREDLLSKHKILRLIDYSLHPVPLFQDAVNYPLIIAVKKEKPDNSHRVKITVVNTAGKRRDFDLPQKQLILDPRRQRSPWVLAEEPVINVLRKLQSGSPRLGDIYEVMRGAMTSADDIYVGELKACGVGTVALELGGGVTVHVEDDLLHIFVRGEDIDPFQYSWSSYIIFTHDPQSLDPLWDQNQHQVLNTFGVLRHGVKVGAVGSAVSYEDERSIHVSQVNNYIQSIRNSLIKQGFIVQDLSPCGVDACWTILRDGSNVLDASVSVRAANKGISIKYTISGLKLPNYPRATQHFTQHLSRLLRRDDYRASLPPWAIFRVGQEKFREYRIAWQEIARYIEACHLPVWVRISLCGKEVDRLLVPSITVYFLVEENIHRAMKLLLYLNSRLARNLIKLWAWTARGGYYVHNAYNMGHLPIPDLAGIWRFINNIEPEQIKDLNELAKKIISEYGETLEKELLVALGISEEEYRRLVEYGEWLNETTPEEKVSEVFEVAEEEEE